ncbi:hypothetical protein UlMin_012295 [Ulmus minor]
MGIRDALVAISDDHKDNPLTISDAMKDVDSKAWQQTMDLEMDSMYSNQVWELVDLPKGVKPIGCKWIYKIKRGADGRVETYKARLVVKGYTQKEGIDSEETFSPVIMLKSIRILLSIAAHLDYEIWQMDVKTAFLNGRLEESIYMIQPKGFIAKGQENQEAIKGKNTSRGSFTSSDIFHDWIKRKCKKVQEKEEENSHTLIEDVEIFVRQVTSLSRVKHPKLVALFGCCVKEDQCFVVYELCPNGKLSEWLFGKDKVLSIQRLEIAIDSTRGLWFLHTYPEGCIVHRDIKVYFGLSKVIEQGETFVSSEVRGTFGYVDPDYLDNQRVKSAGDVYSFGIVLVQIFSGKKGGNVTEFADPKFERKYSTEAFVLTLQLALSCTALKRQRPSMEQIVEKLEEALNISTKAKAYTPKRSSISKQTNA